MNKPTPRQLEVLQMLSKDYSPAATAETLGISIRSVYSMCELAKNKMELDNTIACAAEAVRRGWIT